jgi:hypothetical protein
MAEARSIPCRLAIQDPTAPWGWRGETVVYGDAPDDKLREIVATCRRGFQAAIEPGKRQEYYRRWQAAQMILMSRGVRP